MRPRQGDGVSVEDPSAGTSQEGGRHQQQQQQQQRQQQLLLQQAGAPTSQGAVALQQHHTALSLVEALSSEVIRKLRLAVAADNKEDREVVCEEVFCDVTGVLDRTAQAQLGIEQAGLSFYSVLARHYASTMGADSAVVVLFLLQNLYGQGYAAPLVALLLHRWLLLKRCKPGGGVPDEQRLRLINVMTLGAAELFLGDVHGGVMSFKPLWQCLCYEVILGQADQLSPVAAAPLAAPERPSRAPPAPPAPPPAPPHGLPPASGPSSQVPLTAAPAPQGASGSGGPGTGSEPWGLYLVPASARRALLAAVAAPLVYYSWSSGTLQALLQHFPPPSATLKPLPGGPVDLQPTRSGAASLLPAWLTTLHSEMLAAASPAREPVHPAQAAGSGGEPTLLPGRPPAGRGSRDGAGTPAAPPGGASTPDPALCTAAPGSLGAPAPAAQHSAPDSARGAGAADGRPGGSGLGPATAWGIQPGRCPLEASAWEGADFIVVEVVDMLGRLRSETGLLQYLKALSTLSGPPPLSSVPLRLITRLRLQSELHSLTTPGAPHYAPVAVRRAAQRALDALFPHGRAMRGIVRMLFRLLHPVDWLGELWLVPLRWATWVYGKALLSTFWLLYHMVVFRVWGRPTAALPPDGTPTTPLPPPARAGDWLPRPDAGLPLEDSHAAVGGAVGGAGAVLQAGRREVALQGAGQLPTWRGQRGPGGRGAGHGSSFAVRVSDSSLGSSSSRTSVDQM